MEDVNSKPQSATQAEDVTAKSGGETHQVVTFDDGEQTTWSTEPKSNPDSSYEQDLHVASATLGQFLERPVLIFTYEVPISPNQFRGVFNPWHLFITNPAVKDKVNNFAFLRGELVLKFVINGTPFHYSRFMASYEPLRGWNEAVGSLIFINSDEHIVYDSQRPKVFLNPTDNTGGEMVLPFFYWKNALSLQDEDEWSNMGSIALETIVPLRVATDTTTTVDISVFAYMRNPELSMPTSAPVFATAQAGKKKKRPTVTKTDEYGSGVVSRPAAVISDIAGRLSNAPIIGPFAMATQMASNAVGGIAKLFGYSNPVQLESTRYYRNYVLGQTANTMGDDIVAKLTYDGKQEVTVDPRVVGLDGEDQMSLDTFWERESYLVTFPWTVSDRPNDILWKMIVSPSLYRTNGDIRFTTPAAFAMMPFRYWRGTLVLRLQVICSAYHRGRMKISYDPVNDSGNSADQYNTYFSEVIDLTETQDVTVEIPWAQNVAYKRFAGDFNPESSLFGSSLTNPLDLGLYTNGMINISVVNSLNAPLTTADIDIAVYVSWKDFEARDPTAAGIKETCFANLESPPAVSATLQSGRITKDNEDDCKERSAIYYGDPIVSIRQLLKRYYWSRTIVPKTPSQQNYTIWRVNYPYGINSKGYLDEAFDKDVSNDSYNYVKQTPLTWFRYCYLGWRGGLRYKFMTAHQGNTNNVKIWHGTDYGGNFNDYIILSNTSDVNGQARYMITNRRATPSGMLLNNQRTQDGEGVEIPFYEQYKFNLARSKSISGSKTQKRYLCWERAIHPNNTFSGTPTSENIRPYVDMYTSVGEDFSFYWMLNTPVYRINHVEPDPL